MTWLPIRGYDGYSVSDAGDVRSRSGVLKPNIARRYPRVRLYAGSRQSGRMFYVHRLVLEAFVGPSPPGMEAGHMDGIRSNNALENLRWITSRENAQDRDRHGTTMRGESHWRTRLTDEAVRYIRSSPKGIRVLAVELGVAFSQVSAIRRGLSWKHVTPR